MTKKDEKALAILKRFIRKELDKSIQCDLWGSNMKFSEIKEVIETDVRNRMPNGEIYKVEYSTLEFYNGFIIKVIDNKKGEFRIEWDIAVQEYPMGSDECKWIEYKYYGKNPFNGDFQHSKYIRSRIDNMDRVEFAEAMYRLIWNIYTARCKKISKMS